MSAQSPNASIDKAINKLLKDTEGDIAPDKETQIKVKAEVLKVAMAWEKLKRNIRDGEDEGSEFGAQRD